MIISLGIAEYSDIQFLEMDHMELIRKELTQQMASAVDQTIS